MHDVTLVYVITVTLRMAVGIHGYSAGPPSGVCDSMTPNHQQNIPQSNVNVPYTISFGGGDNHYHSGEKITVTVSGSTFKGVMLQARDSSNNRVGTMELNTGETKLKILSCAPQGQAVTHNSADQKQTASATWTAPSSDIGAVTFRATVVTNFNTYYVGITSTPLTYMDMSATNNNNNMVSTTPYNNNNNGGNGAESRFRCNSFMLVISLVFVACSKLFNPMAS